MGRVTAQGLRAALSTGSKAITFSGRLRLGRQLEVHLRRVGILADDGKGRKVLRAFAFTNDSLGVLKHLVHGHGVHLTPVVIAILDGLLQEATRGLRGNRVRNDLAVAAFLLDPGDVGHGNPQGAIIYGEADVGCVRMPRGDGDNGGLPDAMQLLTGPAIVRYKVLIHSVRLDAPSRLGKHPAGGITRQEEIVMKILVIGAGGGTGEELVKQAQQMGHEVTALVHHAEKFEAPAGVRVVEGDVLNPATLDKAVPGQDAVVDTLGGHTPWKETSMETDAARNVIEAMGKYGVKRLVVVSAIGVGGTADLVPGWYEKLIMPTFLRGAMKDKEQMEPLVEGSDLDWTLVRPGHLVNGDPTGVVRTFEPGTGEIAHKITRADTAAFILEALAKGTHIRAAVNIASN